MWWRQSNGRYEPWYQDINSHLSHYKFPIQTVGWSCLRTTKIECAIWLAKRRVYMRVCKHGCDVKMFCILCANHASMNLNRFLSWKLDKSTLFTHSFVGWNLENLFKHTMSIFFHVNCYFEHEKSVFRKASFLQNKNWYACKTSCARLHNW